MSKKRKLDQFDLEAEREGNGIKLFNQNFRIKRPMGRRLIKDQKRIERGEGILQNRAEKKHIL